MENDKNILYLECLSGISGDMTVAALLDLGADEQKLRQAIDSLQLEGAHIEISRVKKSGLDACDFNVVLDAVHENHDHDMEYLHGHEHDHHEHDHHDHHEHDHHDHDHHEHDHHDHDHHEHDHHDHEHHDHEHHDHEHHDHEHHDHDHHHHEHRGMAEITAIIERGSLTDGAKALAFRIFDILADAESKAHGVPREQVHFHEVGAVDSIIDIVAAAVCLDDLAPAEVVISPLTEGCGTIRCQHGILPIPVPAVANIVSAHGLTIHAAPIHGELVTPTGAAIAAALGGQKHVLPEEYQIKKIGLGAGKRDYEAAGILRAMWIAPAQNVRREDCIMKLEANIDDVTGEQMGFCMERLFEAGARDVSFQPVYMKKNRPAYELHVICMPQDVSVMEEIIFRETTTIGIRRIAMERTVMEREIKKVETPYGMAQVKICRYGKLVKVYPEYDSAAMLCRDHGLSFQEAYQLICESAKN